MLLNAIKKRIEIKTFDSSTEPLRRIPMTDAGSIANNGVNVAALIAAREELTKAPAGAQFKWRAACEWKNGTHSHSTVEGFYGLGQEQHHKRTFSFDADHPELFASEDKGATPVEYVLVGCLQGGCRGGGQKHTDELDVPILYRSRAPCASSRRCQWKSGLTSAPRLPHAVHGTQGRIAGHG
jgi:hypothetical protein